MLFYAHSHGSLVDSHGSHGSHGSHVDSHDSLARILYILVYNTPRDYEDRRLHQFFFYQSEPIDQSTINMDCNSNLKKSDE